MAIYDYKRLLEQYLHHVVACEGTTLLDSMDYDNTVNEEDLEQLRKVARRLGHGE